MPDLDMLAYLPLFLNSLLDCLCDPFGEVRAQATKVLQVGRTCRAVPRDSLSWLEVTTSRQLNGSGHRMLGS